MKILTAHQPTAYSYLALYHKIALADKFCIFDDCQMSGDQWENRNRIKGPNGEFWLTIPLKSKGYRDKKIYELEIDNTQRWRDKHFKSIWLAYKKAPHWNEFAEFFNSLYKREWGLLTEFNEYFLKWALQILNINIEFVKASELHFKGQKSELVLDMCRKLKAHIYIFGSQGENYADKQAFEKAGIKLYFQKYVHPIYPQLWGNGFMPYMSVIDLLFNVGEEQAKEIIMQNNITKKQLMEGNL